MTIPDCLARNTLARWFRFAVVAALALAAIAAPHKPAGRKRVGAKKAAAATKASKAKAASKAAKAELAAKPASKVRSSGLAGLVEAWRESPTPARRAAIASWAAAHPKDRDLAKLALGVGAYEQRDFARAIAILQPLGARLPQLADYIGYYSGAARVETKDLKGAQQDLAAAHRAAVASPLDGQAWIAESRGLLEPGAAVAVQLLRDHYRQLPQPEGDLALGAAFHAAGEPGRAAECYQNVYYQYPGTGAAQKAGAAMAALRESMGTGYPVPPVDLMLRRGDRLLEARDYAGARREFEKLANELGGIDQARARVRIGSTDLWSGNASAAYRYLSGLGLGASDAEAERLYFVVESARRLREDGGMLAAVEALGRHYAKSTWRAKALVAAGNRYLLTNEPARYVPFYEAVYANFPADPQAAFCHWKVTFAAYIGGGRDTSDLLRDHVKYFGWHPTAAAALYFLGRRAEAAGEAGEARVYYSRIGALFPNQYYGVLARERLEQVRAAGGGESANRFLSTVTFPARPAPASEATPATAGHIERARLLRSAGLSGLADAELRYGARIDGQPVLLGMEMAASAGAIHQSLRLMKAFAPDYLNLPVESAPRRLWELLFPIPYRTDIARSAAEREIDLYVLTGLIRQESEFNPQALSRAMAYGLTQVRPPTGRMFARKVGLKRLTAPMLFQPALNLKVGTAILRSMYDSNGGKWERTLAAYNAGPNRVALWLTWYRYREPAEFVETIPITETRDYVQAVLRNADIYRRLYERRGGGAVAELGASGVSAALSSE
jgi:soluble lytic murein transglycosylase